MIRLSVVLFFVSLSVRAETGADALLNTVEPQSGNPSAALLSNASGIKLTDPFLVQFFTEWQQEKALSFDVNSWAIKVLQGKTADAAHLWSAIQPQLPASFETTARIAYLYLLWKSDVPQTFFHEWTAQLSRPSYQQSKTAVGLEQTITPGFDAWLVDNAIQSDTSLHELVGKIDPSRGALFTTLRAWLALRQGKAGLPLLEMLPTDHRLKIPLARTVALALAREKDLKSAGTVLKKHMEPAIEAIRSKDALALHYMEVARLLYQAGAVDAAEAFYEKVPNGSPDYLSAREELTWVRLLKGENNKLRGDLETLSTGLFKNKFAPDVYVVRAISNLKLCFYDEAEKDIKAFVEQNARWAKEINAALKTEDPAPAGIHDYFSDVAEAALNKRTEEVARLKLLGEQSIGATLPAVGPQSHWEKARTQMVMDVETAKKVRAHEYRRQWKNRKYVLSEAIKKMQFVKVELLSQIRMLSKSAGPAPTASAPAAKDQIVAEALKSDDSRADMTFPFDGVVWPDELFRLRSVAQTRCLGKVAQ